MLKIKGDAAPVCWSVPFDRNPRFVGRSTLLAELEAKLAPAGPFKKMAVVGLGGVGKTQIALELAYRTRDKFPRRSIFWVPALSVDSIRKAFLDIARQLDVPGLEEPEADLLGLVQQHLSGKSTGQWLLIVDNADDADVLSESCASNASSVRLADCLPRSECGAILITTRSYKVAAQMAGCGVVAVPEMDELMAMELLRKSLFAPQLVDDVGLALELVKQLTLLPLAIVQAVAYINANGVSLAEYMSLLRETDDGVVNLLSENFEDEGRYPEAKNSIATTWLISFERIRRHDSLAADYLAFMACVEPKTIPPSLLPKAETRKTMLESIGVLTAYSFVTKRPESEVYDMHRLVHMAMRNWMKSKQLLDITEVEVLVRLASIFPSYDPANREWWRAYLPHARTVLEQVSAEKRTDARSQLLGKVGGCLHADGRYNEANLMFVQLVDLRKQLLGHEHPETLASIASQVTTYRYQARLTEAEALGVQVLESRKRVLGLEHPDTLTSMANLAATYRQQWRLTEAEALGVQVLESRKRVLGQEHPDTLTSMANLALTYWQQGRLTKAEALGVQVLESR
jgi:hypothetical protein